jgi:phosphoenolpyruvate synthase/pyruvate phosphate dikinase
MQFSKIRTKKDVLMQYLLKYFEDENKISIVEKIVTGKSNLSLRLLDWVVTNYSKKYGTSYLLVKDNNNVNFIIYLEYKDQLDGLSKKNFDVFCRGDRIILELNNGNKLETTVGQLKFFKWAIDNKLLNYVEENIKQIENDMTSSLKNKYNKKNNNQRRKRTTLSVSATKTIKKYDVSIIVDFN